ncbi:1-phosphofructokinase [Pseudovibrio exalbescens]|uniref:Phosphofructokinase n=1 Tax=Pseudovibrio exalbescens TaxID=197461 RepID=A0A1U7JF72_9HYPH|nr:1-phosphofructokinase [Pseudovibrio exalbescens]OKL43338.1 1-phosphofructokinase [Pseudovibrio exalbescens]
MSPKNPRVATITLNPAIDQSVIAPGFTIDAVNRAQSSQKDVGGKGINVASFLNIMGHEVAAAGLLGADNDGLFRRHFEATGIADICTRVPGETRTNIKILSPDTNQVTDLNLPGITVAPAELERVKLAVETMKPQGLQWLGLCGSLPKGLPDTTYRDLIRWAHDHGLRTVLDASGRSLEVALNVRPDIIKPNNHELGEILGTPLTTRDEVARAARDLASDGIRLVAVSMGADGAVLSTRNATVHAQAQAPNVISTVGAGDAMVSGLVISQLEELSLEETARLATAMSLGALGETGPRLPAPERIWELATTVTVTAL